MRYLRSRLFWLPMCSVSATVVMPLRSILSAESAMLLSPLLMAATMAAAFTPSASVTSAMRAP